MNDNEIREGSSQSPFISLYDSLTDICDGYGILWERVGEFMDSYSALTREKQRDLQRSAPNDFAELDVANQMAHDGIRSFFQCISQHKRKFEERFGRSDIRRLIASIDCLRRDLPVPSGATLALAIRGRSSHFLLQNKDDVHEAMGHARRFTTEILAELWHPSAEEIDDADSKDKPKYEAPFLHFRRNKRKFNLRRGRSISLWGVDLLAMFQEQRWPRAIVLENVDSNVQMTVGRLSRNSEEIGLRFSLEGTQVRWHAVEEQ